MLEIFTHIANNSVLYLLLYDKYNIFQKIRTQKIEQYIEYVLFIRFVRFCIHVVYNLVYIVSHLVYSLYDVISIYIFHYVGPLPHNQNMLAVNSSWCRCFTIDYPGNNRFLLLLDHRK